MEGSFGGRGTRDALVLQPYHDEMIEELIRWRRCRGPETLLLLRAAASVVWPMMLCV
ncbi:MAG: hypothetical protein ACPIOQ_74875 [Promethearchaeia archaeon]